MDTPNCKICGGEIICTRLTVERGIARIGNHGSVGLAPVNENPLVLHYSPVICDTCVSCGNITNIRAEEPGNLK